MEIERQDHEHDVANFAQEQTGLPGRGGSAAGIAAALGRPAAGAGLAHWGGPLPRRATPTTPSAKECGPEITNGA